MGLFKKKQGDIDRGSMSKLSSNLPNFPKYTEGNEQKEIRIRPSLPPLKLPPPLIEPVFEEPKEEAEYHSPEFEEFQTPIRRPFKPMLGEEPIIGSEMFTHHITNDAKPIFVKLEKYKSAINSINELKRKIKETEELIHEIEIIKAQEDKELANWQKHISDIKSKL